MIDAIMPILSDLITATLLYVQATAFRSRALTVLASTFVLIALLLVTHMLTFPRRLRSRRPARRRGEHDRLGYILRRAALPLGVLLYVVLRQVELTYAAVAAEARRASLAGDPVGGRAGRAPSRRSVTLGHDLLAAPVLRPPASRSAAISSDGQPGADRPRARRNVRLARPPPFGARHVAAGRAVRLARPDAAQHARLGPVHDRLLRPVRLDAGLEPDPRCSPYWPRSGRLYTSWRCRPPRATASATPG